MALTKRIYDAMRTNGSVTSADTAIAAKRDKGLDPDNDRVTRSDFVRRGTLQLNDLYRKGKAEKTGRGARDAVEINLVTRNDQD